MSRTYNQRRIERARRERMTRAYNIAVECVVYTTLTLCAVAAFASIMTFATLAFEVLQ